MIRSLENGYLSCVRLISDDSIQTYILIENLDQYRAHVINYFNDEYSISGIYYRLIND